MDIITGEEAIALINRTMGNIQSDYFEIAQDYFKSLRMAQLNPGWAPEEGWIDWVANTRYHLDHLLSLLNACTRLMAVCHDVYNPQLITDTEQTIAVIRASMGNIEHFIEVHPGNPEAALEILKVISRQLDDHNMYAVSNWLRISSVT